MDCACGVLHLLAGQAAEWTVGLFVLKLKGEDEERIGTSLHLNHIASAFEHETLEMIIL